MIVFRSPLRLLSLLYGSGVVLRNALYDNGRFKSVAFDLPVIGIGNLRVGGTGKTPCAEYLIERLKEHRPAMVSRGYGRRTAGFRFVETSGTAREVGDEPLQVKHKFPDVPVAVCEDRVEGIVKLLAEKEAGLIILDDAFQHRHVKPSYNIVLSSFHQPFFRDSLLPLGRLREHPRFLNRADAVIFTKCPEGWQERRDRYIAGVREFATNPIVCFSTLAYDAPRPLFNAPASDIRNDILLVTGIADSGPLRDHLESQGFRICRHFDYPDHYAFLDSDPENWRRELKRHKAAKPVVFTTEKDAMRLLGMRAVVDDIPLFVVPMKMQIAEGEKALLDALAKRLKQVQDHHD